MEMENKAVSHSTSSYQNKQRSQKSKNRKPTFWNKDKALTYYFMALTLILIYAVYNIETAQKMIEMLIKTMSFVFDNM